MNFRSLALGKLGSDDIRPPGQQLRVVYFAVRDVGYPRNERLRAFLQDELGARVDVIGSTISGGRFHRYFSQMKLVFKQRTDYDVVVLSEFSLNFFLFSWLLAKRSRAAHIVDFFVGLHETEVGDDKSTKRRSFRARLLAWIDLMAIRSADACFTDTEVRARRFAELDGGRTPFASLPVGAPAWALDAELSGSQADEWNPRSPVRLLYYGSYLALHGLSSLVEALQGLGDLDFSLLMIGRGPDRERIESLVLESTLTSKVTFIDYAEPDVLVAHINNADVLVGVFGESDKAAEVIANKVWQGLYMGKIVVTRASVALQEISDVAGPLLVQVGSSQPSEIGLAIAKASHDLRTATLDLDRRVRIRTALERLVVDRYAQVFDTEPYASAFPSSSISSAPARGAEGGQQADRQHASRARGRDET